MGNALPKPVRSVVIERHEHPKFRVGSAELNGFRSSMEDAHLVFMQEDWGFFGVFDGHGGDMCSKFVAKELRDELEAGGCPADDAAVRKLLFKVDDAFLKTGQSSGTTAAMCIVHPSPTGPRLRLVNAGDSRVLLGKRDGTIVDGGGTDQGLSTDHKPNEPGERERILRCGGTVESLNGVSRVNGDLAVSRGFGDGEYKKTGGPGPEDRPVTVDPELKEFTADQADFMMIVCDGVSEGDFPNPEVVRLAADVLAKTGDDLGDACRQVCEKAVDTNSKDNVSCMIITFDQRNVEAKMDQEFIPGPVAALEHKGFMKAYKEMALRGNKSLSEALQMRYEALVALKADKELNEDEKKELESLTPADEEMRSFFDKLAADVLASGGGGGEGAFDMQQVMSNPAMLQQMLGAMGGGPPVADDGRKVQAADIATLKDAVEQHPALKWDDRMKDIAGQEGIVKQDDTDGTSQVRFPSLGIAAWLPTDVLTDL